MTKIEDENRERTRDGELAKEQKRGNERKTKMRQRERERERERERANEAIE